MPIQAAPRMTARQRAIQLASLDEFLRTGQDPSHINRLDQAFSQQLETMLRAAPANIRTEIYSGFRTNERQRELFNEAVQKYGSEKAARRHVAPPGKSFHNKGMAADLDFLSPEAKKWFHANAAKYGLSFPMSWEPWHIEPIGNRNGQAGRAQTTQIQQALANAGFLTPADVDGISGPQTRSAIKAYQQKMGLPVDGIAGPQTLAAMEANAPGLLSRAATATGNVASTIGQGALFATTGASAPREQIKTLQNSLASRGFDPGPMDGIHGPRTQAALDASREAQTQSGRMGRPIQQTPASAVPSPFSLPDMSPPSTPPSSTNQRDVIRSRINNTTRDVGAGDQATTDRSEFSALATGERASTNPAMGFSFDVNIPASTPAPSGKANVVLGQFRQAGVGTPLQIVWRAADGSISARVEAAGGGSAYHKLLDKADVQGKFHRFDIDGVWSDTNAGQLKVRVDGAEKFSSLNTPNLPSNAGTVYPKFGLYRRDANTDPARPDIQVSFQNIQRRSTFEAGGAGGRYLGDQKDYPGFGPANAVGSSGLKSAGWASPQGLSQIPGTGAKSGGGLQAQGAGFAGGVPPDYTGQPAPAATSSKGGRYVPPQGGGFLKGLQDFHDNFITKGTAAPVSTPTHLPSMSPPTQSGYNALSGANTGLARPSGVATGLVGQNARTPIGTTANRLGQSPQRSAPTGAPTQSLYDILSGANTGLAKQKSSTWATAQQTAYDTPMRPYSNPTGIVSTPQRVAGVNPNMAFPTVAGRPAALTLNPDRTKDDDIGAVPPATIAARLPTARPAYTPPPATQAPAVKPPAPPAPTAKPALGQTLFETLASGAKDLAKSAIKPAVSFYMASGPVERAAKIGEARGAPGFWDAINASRLGPTDIARASYMAAQLYGPQALAAPMAMQRVAQVNQAGGRSSAGVNTSRSAGRGSTDAFGNAYGSNAYGTGRRGY